MTTNPLVLKIFVASPSDVTDEREELRDVISEFNKTWGDHKNVRLEIIGWEDLRPGFGIDPQDVINKQIGDEYDIFIGIMWSRFGSPTSRAESGSEEEFNRAYSRYLSSPNSIQIMFYFKDEKVTPSNIVPNQLAKVQEFMDKVRSKCGGFIQSFVSTEDFKNKVRMHISSLVQDWLNNKTEEDTTSNTAKDTEANEEVINPLSNLMAISDDDYSDGIIELAELAVDSINTVADVLNNISNATSDLGKIFKQRTKDANLVSKNNANQNHKVIKRISNSAANDLEMYIERLMVEICAFHKHHSIAFDSFGKLAMISYDELDEYPNDIRDTLKHIQEYHNSISSASESISEFQMAVESVPRLTVKFSRARKRTVAILNDLLQQFRSATNQLVDAENLLKRMIDNANNKHR